MVVHVCLSVVLHAKTTELMSTKFCTKIPYIPGSVIGVSGSISFPFKNGGPFIDVGTF